MDQQLKARKMASASARKQKFAERQKQQSIMHEQREERKRRMMRYSEVYSTDTSPNSSRSGSPENDSSADTPSEYSVRTPDNSFSEIEVKVQSLDLGSPDAVKQDLDSMSAKKETLLERRLSKSRIDTSGTSSTMFGASLNRPCDFRYDRFSTIIEPVNIEQKLAETESISSSDDEQESEDDYSPIEVATPVAIRMPISRPSVISVAVNEAGPQRFSVKNINTIMINPPRVAASKPRQLGSISDIRHNNGSGFLASEASPLTTVPSNTNSVATVETVSNGSQSCVDPTETDPSLRKKSSMQMLSKFKHARMSSLKNFMKPQSISGPPPAVPQVPSQHQSHHSESSNSLLSPPKKHVDRVMQAEKSAPASPRRSLTEPVPLKDVSQQARPQTARNTRQSSLFLTVQSSTVRPPSMQVVPPTNEPEEPAMVRKKSFSNLRRRSGSLGQALKFSNSSRAKSPAPETPLPPVPTIQIPRNSSVDASNLPTPPPKTPKSVRKSAMMYSPFPPTQPQRGEPVGLGLRL